MSASPPGILFVVLCPHFGSNFLFFSKFGACWPGGRFGNKKQVLALTGLKEATGGFRDTVKNKINEISQSRPSLQGRISGGMFALELPTI